MVAEGFGKILLDERMLTSFFDDRYQWLQILQVIS